VVAEAVTPAVVAAHATTTTGMEDIGLENVGIMRRRGVSTNRRGIRVRRRGTGAR